jgi:hypothetical protein
MKNTGIGVFFVATIIMIASCSKSNDFTVEGRITHAENQMIYLDELHISGSVLVDSAKINKKGEFTLRGGTSIPAFYLLYLNRDKIITLLADSAETIRVYADKVNFGIKYQVEGSPGSVQVKELTDRLNTTKQKLDSIASLNVIFQSRPNYQDLKAQLDEASEKIVQEQVEFSTRFVEKYPFSMASVLALYQKFDNDTYVITALQPLKTVASALHSIYPTSEHVKVLYANTLELVNSERAAKLKKLIEEKGTNSPDIVLPDSHGQDQALSTLKGKYVLLQFWSAADRGSRIVNQTLVELYEEFQHKGLEIYQVSVDTDRNAWIHAIKEDHLTWINVGDMEGSHKAVITYNIREIPYNYFLDREGGIITKGLTGQKLYETVSQYLK